jgi:hypothetical protein
MNVELFSAAALKASWENYTPVVLPTGRQNNELWEGHSFMLHITCDLCGKEMLPGEDHRYVVKLEVYAAHDPAEITEADLDEDHMEAVSQMLREMEEDDVADSELAPAYKKFRYDLCPECQKKFVRDPLGKEAAQKFDFSEN